MFVTSKKDLNPWQKKNNENSKMNYVNIQFHNNIAVVFFNSKTSLTITFFSFFYNLILHDHWYFIFKLSHFLGSQLRFPIGIPLRGIARNDCFRLRHFIAPNCAIIANKEAIKHSRNCAELRGIACNGIAFPSKNQ